MPDSSDEYVKKFVGTLVEGTYSDVDFKSGQWIYSSNTFPPHRIIVDPIAVNEYLDEVADYIRSLAQAE